MQFDLINGQIVRGEMIASMIIVQSLLDTQLRGVPESTNRIWVHTKCVNFTYS